MTELSQALRRAGDSVSLNIAITAVIKYPSDRIEASGDGFETQYLRNSVDILLAMYGDRWRSFTRDCPTTTATKIVKQRFTGCKTRLEGLQFLDIRTSCRPLIETVANNAAGYFGSQTIASITTRRNLPPKLQHLAVHDSLRNTYISLQGVTEHFSQLTELHIPALTWSPHIRESFPKLQTLHLEVIPRLGSPIIHWNLPSLQHLSILERFPTDFFINADPSLTPFAPICHKLKSLMYISEYNGDVNVTGILPNAEYLCGSDRIHFTGQHQHIPLIEYRSFQFS